MNLACSVMGICTGKDFTPGRELRQCSFCEASYFQLPSILQLSEVSVFGCMVFTHVFCIFYYNPLLKKKLQRSESESTIDLRGQRGSLLRLKSWSLLAQVFSSEEVLTVASH